MRQARLAAILALDVVGYSQKMQENADGLVSALTEVLGKIVRPAANAAGGHIVKLMGDGALIEFPAASSALRCAVQIQREMQQEDAPYNFNEPILLRAGLHAGEILPDQNDVFGDTVNLAARLEAAASPGGILVSSVFRELAASHSLEVFEYEGARSFKGIDQPVDVYSVPLKDVEQRQRRSNLQQSQEIRFCSSSDGATLAWTSIGEGPPIVHTQAWIGHLNLDWQHPSRAHLLEAISDYRSIVRFDARGAGLSQRDVEEITFEHFVDDLESVFDAAGIERAPVLALSQGCSIAVAFAARRPERVSALIMIGGYSEGRGQRSSQKERDMATAMTSMMKAGWDDEYPSLRDLIAQTIIPGASEEQRRKLAEAMRQTINGETQARYRQTLNNVNVTDLLRNVQAPALVLHCDNDRIVPIDQGRKLAAGLPNAIFRSYDSSNHIPPENDPICAAMHKDILEFLLRTE